MKKIFGYKSITHLLYGLLLLLPFLAILGRSVYTIANKNAKDSYYGETINETQIDYTNDLVENSTYYISNGALQGLITSNGAFNQNIYINDLVIEGYNQDLSVVDYFRLYSSSNGNIELLAFDNTSLLYDVYLTTSNYVASFTFLYFSNNSTGVYSYADYDLFYTFLYNKYSYLDNAFEYSLSTFIDDNQMGNVDFFSWFTNIFLNQTSPHNALYLNFANWYLNYIMLVSCGYLLFLVLLWFVNYSRSLLDRGMNRNNGGF